MLIQKLLVYDRTGLLRDLFVQTHLVFLEVYCIVLYVEMSVNGRLADYSAYLHEQESTVWIIYD